MRPQAIRGSVGVSRLDGLEDLAMLRGLLLLQLDLAGQPAMMMSATRSPMSSRID